MTKTPLKGSQTRAQSSPCGMNDLSYAFSVRLDISGSIKETMEQPDQTSGAYLQ